MEKLRHRAATHPSAPAVAWTPSPSVPFLGAGSPCAPHWASTQPGGQTGRLLRHPAVELAASGRWHLEQVDARVAGLADPTPCRPAAVQEAEDSLSRTQEPRAFHTGGL